METSAVYSSKAGKYAKYRWDYAPEAIDTLVKQTGLSEGSCVADVGSGTGILTRHFVERVKRVYAVEVNTEMRSFAERSLSGYPAFQSVEGCAEATTLPAHSVDLITAAQAIHWFQADAARQEFRRVIRPGGWFAVLRNYSTGHELDAAMRGVYREEYGVAPITNVGHPANQPAPFYFELDGFQTFVFEFTNNLSWDAFLGSTLSAAFAPTEDHPRYPAFEQALRRIFSSFSSGEHVAIRGATELHLGQIGDSPVPH